MYMYKKQLIYSILALFLIGFIVTGGTFAYLSWRSDNNKSVIFNTAKNLEKYIVYDEGDSKFIGDFKVSSTYTEGMHSTISLYKTSEAANVNLLATINMDVNSIGNYMKQSRAVKWTVTSGTSTNVGSVLAQGNFIGVNNGDTLTLVPNIDVTTTKTYYTVWLWIDSSLNPSDNLTGETLDTTVWTEISQVEGVEDKFEITRINANYQNINATVVNNKHKITAYAVTTSNTTPSSWTSISSTEQSNVYNLNHTVSQTGTYYVWFKSDDNKTVSRSIAVTSVDTTAPVCTWGTFTDDPIQNNTTSEITLTCIDNESEITINNLKVDNIITSNSNITVMSIARATQSNGYKYTITVKGTANDGETTLTIPANTIKNAMGLGNAVKTSSAITVANTYTVKYQTGNNACSLNTTTYKDYEATYGTVFNIANPSCSGYTFQGWTANSGLDTTNAKYGTSSSAVTTTWSNASTKVTATWFNNLAKRDTKEVTLTANWSDSTKPVCTVSTPSSISYGSTTTVNVTCTDNAAMSSQTLATSNFTSSNTGVATVQSVSNPTAVTNGYKYTVTMKGVGVGSYTLSINANAITDSTGNKNDKATSSNGTVTAKSLTPSINTCTSKTYDGKTNATCTISLATIESGDTVTASGTCTFDNKNVGNNKTVSCSSISLSGTNAAKYTLSSTTASKTSAANITAFTPTVSLSAKSAAYTGSAINANTATVTLTNSETYSGTITYKYYSNNTCTTEVTTSNSGASATGAAPVKVGTWYAQASIAASGNYAAAKSACVAHTITQKKGTITLTNSSVSLTYKTSGSNTYTYDGDGTVSCSSSNTSYVTCSVDTTNHKINVVPVAKTSSAITITVSAGAGTNYSAADNKTFTVTVAAFTPTVSLTAKTDAQRTFTGSAIAANTATVTLTNSETYSGTINYTYYTNNACSAGATTTAPTYGTWYVKASIAASGNYNEASSGCVNHTIIAATPTVSLSAKTGMTYNGSAQTANTATVSPNGGGAVTYTYYTNNVCSAGATTTAPTNAGSYWVKASVAEVSGKTNAASSSCVDHTISTKSVAVTWGTTTSFAYTGSAQAPTAIATSGVSGETINVTRTTETNVGNYTSTASCSSVSGGQAKCSNYTLTGTTKAYSITEVAATCPTLTAYNKAYDGSAHGITVSGGSGGTIQYRTSTTGSWSNTAPTATNVSTTTVYVQVAGDGNHSDKDCGSSTITITKYTPTITLSPTSGSVNENETAIFTATPTVIDSCKGTLTALSASTSNVTITEGASTENVTSSIAVTYKGINYSTGTKINVNYTPNNTLNCNNAIQQQFTATVNDITPPTGTISSSYSNNTISITISASDSGSGLKESYGYRVSTDSTCNNTVTFNDSTSNTYNFNIAIIGINYICVKVEDNAGNKNYISKVAEASYIDYSYTGNYQTFTVPESGYYKIETWGAQGGSSILEAGTRNTLNDAYCNATTTGYCSGGKGSYASGYINLNSGEELYVYVGGQGGTGVVGGTSAGGYNGGGTGDHDHSDNEADGGGGGATDIRTVNGTWDNASSQNSRIMVAAGGGGASDIYGGLPGGGLINSKTSEANFNRVNFTASNQTSGYQFGIGQNGIMVRSNYPVAGGGGGYYGGISNDNGTDYANIGAGGSSFISGYAGVNAITSVSNRAHNNNTLHYSNKYFVDTEIKPNINSGNGKVKITYVGSKPNRVNSKLNNVKYVKNCTNGSSANFGNHWVELQAIYNGENIAKGKTITSTVSEGNSTTYAFSNIVDGRIENITGSSGFGYSPTSGLQCYTVNLGNNYNLDEIAVWNYYVDNRIYNDTATYVSSDNSNFTPIIATDEFETSEGKRINAYNSSPDYYTLTINPNGGNFNGVTSTITYAKAPNIMRVLPKPTRTGYTFAGWSKTGGGTLSRYGNGMFNDETFSSGVNDFVVYNNSSNGTVTHSRVARTYDSPMSNSSYMMKITTAGAATPGLGGFIQYVTSSANADYYHVIVAKIPVGYSIEHAQNATGNDRTITWLTPTAGTGKFETYIYRHKCGSSGTFSTFGHVYLVGNAATESNPVTWYVAYANMFNATNGTTNQNVSQLFTYGTSSTNLTANWSGNTYTATFYYNSNATNGSTTISSTTASCTVSNAAGTCDITIPSAVRSSVGTYNNAYAGLSASTGNMTQAVAASSTTLTLSGNATYYSLYRTSVTNYYYGSSYTSRTLYRNQWFASSSSMSSTVLSTSTTGTSNYGTAVGPGSSVWTGLSTGADTTQEYSSVAAAATSTATTLYTVYTFNVTYAKGSNVSAIGATSGSCKVTTSSTSCNVTLPSITANTGYTSVGWNTSSGATSGTAAGSAKAISSNATKLYANATDQTAPGKPTGITVVTAYNISNTNITIRATGSSDSGSGLAGYQYRVAGEVTVARSGTIASGTNHTLSGLTFGCKYTVYVRAVDKAGNASAEYSIGPPNAPTSLSGAERSFNGYYWPVVTGYSPSYSDLFTQPKTGAFGSNDSSGGSFIQLSTQLQDADWRGAPLDRLSTRAGSGTVWAYSMNNMGSFSSRSVFNWSTNSSGTFSATKTN